MVQDTQEIIIKKVGKEYITKYVAMLRLAGEDWEQFLKAKGTN